MKTKSNVSVLKLNDGKCICCYCGKPLKVEHDHEWDEYTKYEWNEYECECENWNKAIELDNQLKELNSNFYKYYCEYQRKFKDLMGYPFVSKYKINEEIYKLDK